MTQTPTKVLPGEDEVAALGSAMGAPFPDEPGFRLLVERSRDLICLHQPDGRYLYVSPAARELLGFEAEQLLGRDPYDFFHPDDVADQVRQAHERVRSGHVNQSARYRFRHREGHHVWLETLAVPLFDDAAEPARVTGLLTSSRDVSGQVAAAEGQATSDERLRLALLATDTGLCDVKMPEGTGYFSAGYLHLFGYGAADMPLFAAGWTPLVHPDDLPRFLAALQRALSGEHDLIELECRRMHRSGRYVWVRVVAHAVDKDAAGRPTRLIGTLHDVDARRRFEHALRDGQRRLAQTQRLAGLGDWRTDVDEPSQRWSDEIYHIAGLDPATTEPSLETFLACLHPDDRQALREADAAAARDGISFERDSRLIRPDGSVRHVFNRTEVLRADTGAVIGMFGTVQDITERKLIEAALREARDQVRELSSHLEDELDRERKRIALDVHDELGQRLTAMKLQIELLQSQLARPDDARRTSEQMRELVEETIEVTRNVALNLRPPALDLGLEAALEWLAEDFSLRTEIACEIETAATDMALEDKQAVALFRIAQESLTNVVRHARASRVWIRLSRHDAGLQLAIGDDGIGFDPARAQCAGHFGLLGMRERAWRLGADIELHSQPGAGCTVQVRLPMAGQATGGTP